MARVLVVDDNEQISDFLSSRLQRRGHEVTVTQDCDQALIAARATLPDVIILDDALPALHGASASDALRGDPITQGVPIIALTSETTSGDRGAANQAGINEYHPKPIDVAKLMEQIEALAPAVEGRA